MMTAFLLARQGVDVVVLEEHKDFLRDFRGDTIHPSTLEVMYELDILEEFLRRPHQRVEELAAKVGTGADAVTVPVADFRHLPTHCKFVALMPQWDFLEFVKEHAMRYSTFHLRMEAEVTGLIEEQGANAGVRVRTPHGELRVRAPLTIGADGRSSAVRELSGLRVKDFGAPMDVMWMRLSRRPDDPGQTFGHADQGRILILINRGDYWQAALAIAKGEAERVREKGLDAFREEIGQLEPFLRDRLDELESWDDVKLLTVKVDRLERWARPGLLCIGDAAHAMSPIGGVGINLAIQDAVATANLLGPVLSKRGPSERELNSVQRRRNFPTFATQWVQIAIQNNIIQNVLRGRQSRTLPWPLKLLQRWPMLRRLPARIVGVGFRPEHVKRVDRPIAHGSTQAAH
jgi:2-polyprenyl-6-methoxyphenol hydroxylase-like FAD-dependent oxidoreductase